MNGEGGKIAAISKKMESFPSGILQRCRHYFFACPACKWKLEGDVAAELWPAMAKRLSGIRGTLEVWTRRREEGAPLKGPRPPFRRIGDAIDGGRPASQRTAADDLDLDTVLWARRWKWIPRPWED